MPFLKNISLQKLKVAVTPTTQYSLWGWGDGTLGQTDNGVLIYNPYQIDSGTTWVSGSGGGSHTVAIKSDGTLWGWGANANGQIGDNSTTTRSSPVQIGTLTNWSKIFAGLTYNHSIKTDGTLWVWGGNYSIAFGFPRPDTPVQMDTDTNWYSIMNGDSDSHTMVIKSDGSLWGWGGNTDGQIGDGTSVNRSSPVQIGTDTNWLSVATGRTNHTIALKTNGTLWSWGNNSGGQIGDGTVINRSSPVQIGTLNTWTKISTGNASFAIKTDGTLWSWGSNSNGELGLNLTTASSGFRSSPVQIGTLTDWYDVSISNVHVIAIKSNGTLWSWGSNSLGELGQINVINRSSPVQIGTLTNWSKVFSGVGYTISIKTDGTLWSWGANTLGYLGDNSVISRSSPIQIGTLTGWSDVATTGTGVVATRTDGTLWAWGSGNASGILPLTNRSSPVQIGTDTNWSSVGGGATYVTALKTNGTLWGWGVNSTGQLGLNHIFSATGGTFNISSPVQVGYETSWSSVSTSNLGGFGTIALKSNGTLWSWGTNTSGELGVSDISNRSSPVQVGTLTNWLKISMGDSHSMAIKTDGTLWGWGTNANGELGNEPITPTRLNLDSWSYTDAGYSYTMGIKSNGTLWGWGIGQVGQLGILHPVEPVQLGTLNEWSFVSGHIHDTVATNFVFGIKTNGTLWSWGINSIGQLGLGDTINRSSPVQVGTDTNWSVVVGGSEHAIGLKTNGTLWSWGNNNNAQLGTGSTRSSPVQVGTLTDWNKIAATQFTSYAIRTNGTLWSWGRATEGQTGLNNTTNVGVPTQVGTLTNWADVSAGVSHVMAIKTDGTMWGWGTNTSGQLGDSSIITRSSPVQIGTLTGWSKVSGGATNSGAVRTDGTLWVWGNNSAGQLAQNETLFNRSSPVQVGTEKDWIDIVFSGGNPLAKKTNGTLWSWGPAGLVIGLGDAQSRSLPVQIGTKTDWNVLAKQTSVSSHFAIDLSGYLWVWGENDVGQMGFGYTLPRISSGISSPMQVGINTDWEKVSAADSFTLGKKTDGTLWSWGVNTSGQLGLNLITTTRKFSPVQIGTNTDWDNFSSLQSFVAAIKTDNTLWTWGDGSNGQLAYEALTPTKLDNQNWSYADTGYSHTIAVKTDGTLWGWGAASFGQLGIPIGVSPIQLDSGANWSVGDISTTSLAIKTDGSLWGWGSNVYGQVGDSTFIDRSSPVQIGTLTDWSKISTGVLLSAAIKTDGTLWTWGYSTGLGINTQAGNRFSPVQVGTLTDWATVKIGYDSGNVSPHAMAIKTDGTLWTWGTGGIWSGLNETTNPSRSSPVQIGTRTGWFDVAVNKKVGGLGFHVLATRTDGTLWAWGTNSDGQLGDGTTVNKSSPVQIGTLTNWSYVATGGNNFSVAVKTDGTLWSWGSGVSGQLGDGTTVSKSSPIQIGTLTNWSRVDCGNNFTFAVKTDGTLWGWGLNSSYQLGDGTNTNRSSPVQIGTRTNWSRVSAGIGTGMAIDSSNNIYVWGVNGSGQLGLNHTISLGSSGNSSPTQIGTLNSWQNISAGETFTIAKKTDNTLWGWGLNSSGQLGLGDTSTRYSPVQIGTTTDWNTFSSLGAHILAIKTNGTLWGWGTNSQGTLGDNTAVSRSSPVQVGTLTDWSNVSAGYNHSLAVRNNGTVWSWGANTSFQLGFVTGGVSRSSPVQVGTLTNWAKVSAGLSHSMAIKTDGTLWAWGGDGSGELGIRPIQPTLIDNNTNWSSASVAASHTISIKNDGTLWTWGNNATGQLGDGTTISRSSPVQVGTLSNWSKIYASQSHCMAIKTDGTLWGWGTNPSGQLAQNDTIDRSSPVQIGTDTNWLSVSAGINFSIALKTNGTLWSWGLNNVGQLGQNNTINRSSPVQIGTDTNWSVISSIGDRTTLAIKTDGTMWGWGLNSQGNIGDNTIIGRSSPVQIGTDTNWLKVECSSNYTLALKTNGTLWAWGSNGNGQLGDNTLTSKSSPIQIGTDADWSKIFAGAGYSTATKTNGTLWGWGVNTSGQLGDGTLVSKSSPVQIGILTNWSIISNGGSHSIAINSSGNLYVWGSNSAGQLGTGTTIGGQTTSLSSPIQVGTLTTWSDVWAGYSRTYATKTDGTLWGWGSATYYLGDILASNVGFGTFPTTPTARYSPVQIGTKTNWSKLSRGFLHIIGIKSDNSMWGWGVNFNGVLGLNPSIAARSSPVQVGDDTFWSKVSVGNNHSLAVKTDGTLWAWGVGTSGRIGDSAAISRSYPVQIGKLTNWAKVSAGLSHSMAIKTDGTLWAWGGDGSGELGIRPIQPTSLGTETNWSIVSTGISYSMAIKTDGTLWSWGNNAAGKLGLNDTVNRSSPVQVGTLNDWLQISSSTAGSSGIKTNGTLWGWGEQDISNPSIGDGTNANRSSPVQIGTLTSWYIISRGSGHTAAIRTNGTLWGWGRNLEGCVGDNTTTPRNSPVQIGTLTNWNNVSAGSLFSHALKTDGTLWSWGWNGQGQLGLNDITQRNSPVQIGTLTNWSKVWSGNSHTMAIKTDGTLWGWGLNTSGQIGDGTVVNRSSPVQIGTLTDWMTVIPSVGFGSHTIAIKTNGTLWGWGANTAGQLGDGTLIGKSSPIQIGTVSNWSSVSSGNSHTIAINSSGNLYVWGLNDNGQLGTNNTIGGQTTSLSSPIQVGTLTTWSDVWATNSRTYATKTDGTLWGWGAATNYLGDTISFPTTPTTRYSPVQIGTKTNWSEIGRGQNHIIGLKSDGSMLGWGLNVQGQLGLNFFSSNTNRSSPVQIGDDTFWSEVSAGANHTLAVKNDGTLWAWGLGTGGRIGDGQVISRSYPVQIGTLTSWSKVNSNIDHSVAITTSGNLWGWGTNTTGKLGDGTIVSKSSPVQLSGTNWKDIKGIGSHSIGISTGGGLYTWGLQTSGQLGYTMQRSSPVQIGDRYWWSKIDGGDLGLHTMGITTDGTLWAWGANNVGQLGDNTVVYRSSPTQIGSLTNWSDVNTSLSHTMAIKTDGTLWGWGRNNSGQVGDGSGLDRSSPVQIGTSTGWAKVSAGGNSDTSMMTMAIKTDGTLWGWGSITNGKTGNILPYVPQRVGTTSDWATVANNVIDTFDFGFSLGIKTDGSLWSWGLNSSGQLGLNDRSNRNSPVQVGTLTNWLSVAAGRSHTIAVKSDGTLWAWGGNSGFGELGDGTSVSKSSPIQIGTMTNWSKVAAGSTTSHAIKTDGTLWGWGQNSGGKVGNGTISHSNSPVQIGTLTNWSTVVSSPSHTMALKTDGTLWGWGGNSFGQIGDGTVINRSSPVQIGTLTDWYRISVQVGVTIAVKTNGTLWGWGLGGQVGDSTSVSRSSPVQIGTLTTWSDTFSQNGNSFAIKTDGTLWGWGSNTRGQLGNGSIDPNGFSPTTSPIQISSNISWSTMSKGGGFSSLAIDTSGNLYSWGQNNNAELGLSNFVSYNVTTSTIPGQVGNETSWSQLSLGADHGIATKTTGTLWGWGLNAAGQIGDGTVTTRSSPIQIGTLTNWSKVSAGASHTMAIKTDGSLWAWGLGTSGQLGTEATIPTRTVDTNLYWSDVAAGTNNAFGIKTDGTLWSWGYNGDAFNGGPLGLNDINPRSSPTQVGTLTNWSKIVPYASSFATLALKTDGTLWSWGSYVSGILGVGPTSTFRSSPVQIGTLTSWSKLYTGGATAAAIRTDDTLWMWGYNNFGNIGNRSVTDVNAPLNLDGSWSTVAMSNEHTLGIRTDGTLWGWGSNILGQLGQNNTTSRSSPVQIGTLNGWSSVAAGSNFSLATRTDGTLWSWGYNNYGTLGQNDTINRSSPVQVGTLTDWSYLYCKDESTVMAIKSNGTLWGWGDNSSAQLGNGTFISRSSPVQIGTMTNWSKVEISNVSIGLKTDNSIVVWGTNAFGQLGRGFVSGLISRSSPIQISADSWSSVYAGNLFTTAIAGDGTLWAWGSNSNGVLGNSTILGRSGPTQIGTYSKWTQVSVGASHTIAIRQE